MTNKLSTKSLRYVFPPLLSLLLFATSAHAQATKIYWVENFADKIQRANLDGTGVEDLVTTGLDAPWGIDVDVAGGKVYWTDFNTDKVQRANLDGTNVEDLITTGLDMPRGVTLNVAAGKMYISDLGTQKILRSNLDGSGIEDFITGLGGPSDTALDLANGHIYIADQLANQIKRADLADGANLVNVLASGVNAIAVDVDGGKIYWGNSAADRVERANLDGSGLETLFAAQPKPYGIALDLDAGKVYWADTNLDKIQRSNLDGTGLETVVNGLPVAGGDIALDAPQPVTPAPELSVAPLIPGAELETVDVDVELATNGESVAATAFSVDYDETCLSFDDTDANADNIPDALNFNLPAGFAVTAFHDLGDSDGEIDVSIADLAPPITTLPDSTLLTITFTSTCSPATAATIIAPTGFSSDPAATFSDDLAVDVDGTTTDGSVEIWPGPRGDCNRNGALSAADLIAEALEIFDGDGTFWADVVGSTFAGSPVGCDANDDTVVDAGDISCTILRIFGGNCGGGGFSFAGADAFDPRTSPVLGLDRPYRDKDGTLWIPVLFSPGSHEISSTAFSLNLANRGLTFDPFDGDGDGLPDSIRFPHGRPDLVDVRYDAADRRGELDLVLGDFDDVLGDGVLLEIAVRSNRRDAGQRPARKLLRFAKDPAASFGNLFGDAVAGKTVNAVTRGTTSST